MPGLVVLISELPSDICTDILESMLRSVQHESFYSYGMYADTEMLTYIGWTSHKNSFTDCMPIYNEKRDIKLFIAGEVFSNTNQMYILRKKKHRFKDGDASYLVHLYEELGENFFIELNGWFFGVVIDRRQGKTLLFNDRFGMHRVFVHDGKKGFFLASEAKSILNILPETREFDPNGLCELMTCGCTIGDRSPFKGIDVLPGGMILDFMNGGLRRKFFYFNRSAWEANDHLNEDDFTSQFTETFPRITKKYISSERSTAMSLTGGLDSRMVIGCLDLQPGSLPCYTFGSAYRDTFDVQVAQKVAIECGQSHTEIVIGNDFLSELSSYLERAVFLSDGYLALSGAVELYANSLARDISPVRLTGNYGGELLRGVRSFKFSIPRGGILSPDLKEFVEETKVTFNDLNAVHNSLSFGAFYQAPHQGYGRLSIERSQLDLRTPFLDNELVALLYKAPKKNNGFTLAENIISQCKPGLCAIPTDRGYLGTSGVLTKIIQRLYREALFKAEYWSSHGTPDWLVRNFHVFNWLHLEDKFLGRHKFYHLRLWIRDFLANYVHDLLTNSSQFEISPYIDKKRLRNVLNDHFQEKKNYLTEIDKMILVALTYRKLLNYSN